jgi:hypothetical protein
MLKLYVKLITYLDAHILSRRGEASLQLSRIVTSLTHASPWKLYPNPLLIVIMNRFLIIEFKIVD